MCAIIICLAVALGVVLLGGNKTYDTYVLDGYNSTIPEYGSFSGAKLTHTSITNKEETTDEHQDYMGVKSLWPDLSQLYVSDIEATYTYSDFDDIDKYVKYLNKNGITISESEEGGLYGVVATLDGTYSIYIRDNSNFLRIEFNRN